MCMVYTCMCTCISVCMCIMHVCVRVLACMPVFGEHSYRSESAIHKDDLGSQSQSLGILTNMYPLD